MGDILISSTGYVSMGKIDIVNSDQKAMADGHITILKLKEGYDPNFVAYYLRSDLGKLQFDRWWTGSSGQIEIQKDDLARFIIPDNSQRGIPLPLQREIASRINSKIEELTRLEKQKLQYTSNVDSLYEEFIREHLS